MPEYLTVGDVIALHARVMARTGSRPEALRDAGLLEAALNRPLMAAHYEGAGIIRQAAILAIAISQAQAFVDGNKWAAFAACDVFLRINGIVISGNSLEWAEFILRAAHPGANLPALLDDFTRWLDSHAG